VQRYSFFWNLYHFSRKVLLISTNFLIFVGKEQLLTAKLTSYEKNAETNRDGHLLFGKRYGAGAR
jgi:hypothetical protein